LLFLIKALLLLLFSEQLAHPPRHLRAHLDHHHHNTNTTNDNDDDYANNDN
jgi:hypothetical protein